jgi:hypothetical protein
LESNYSIKLREHPIRSGSILFDTNKPIQALRLLTMQGAIVDQQLSSQSIGSVNWRLSQSIRGPHVLSIHFADGSTDHQVVLIK